jgi:hypothetical protein
MLGGAGPHIEAEVQPCGAAALREIILLARADPSAIPPRYTAPYRSTNHHVETYAVPSRAR